MRFYKFTFTYIAFVMLVQPTVAQKNDSCKINLNAGADLMSRYIWRGTQFGGSSPSAQPGVSFSYKGLKTGAWGAFSLGGVNPSQELDLYLSYTFLKNYLTLTCTDYFFPNETLNYKYFNYKKDETGHIEELALNFNGTEKVPLNLLIAVNLWGADAVRLEENPNSPDFNTKSGIQYSSYVELSYPTKINDIDIKPFIAATLNNPKKENTTTGFIGETGFYGTSPGIINLGFTAVKKIEMTDRFTLPASVSLITNPQSEKIYLVFGLTF